MTDQISIHLQRFNDRIKVMNQTRAKDLTMSADDARNLHTEVFSLLAQISFLSNKANELQQEDKSTIEVQLDGGAWK